MAETAFYKTCIKEELARRCEKNPRYSLRAFAKSLGLDAAAISRILSGKLIPSLKTAQKLILALALCPEEEMRFMASLGETHRARQLQRINPAFRKGPPRISSSQRELSIDLFRVIADWYHYAILELTFTSGFRPDPKWIAAELGIAPVEARLAVERLFSLGLLQQRSDTIRKVDQQLTTADKALSTSALRRRQKQILDKALSSLDSDPIEERSNTTMTMAIDPSRIAEAKEMILRFNRELCEFLESGNRSRVYELSIALFPIQKRSKKK